MEAVFKEKSYPANYPADALAVINTMSFTSGKGVKILGSMSMRSQQYAGDYDCFEEVDTDVGNPLQHLARGFQNIIKNLRSEKNIFIGDIKSGAVQKWRILNQNAGVVDNKIVNYNAVECRSRIDELERDKVISSGEAKYANSLIKDSPSVEEFLDAKKELKFHIVRWSPNEVIHGSKVLRDKRRYTLEEAFNSQSLTKLDVIALIQNSRYTDFSMIYEFFSKGEPLNEFPLNVAQSLKEDILYYKAHGNNFKVLKRELALAKLTKNSSAVAELVPILNSDLGRLYLISSDISTLIDLFENERKVPMKMVRFELDQMKARMGNIYNLPDFLSEEHDLIGDINAVLKMTNKAQILSRLNQIRTRMDDILNSNAKAKRGGATEAERGRASKLRERYFLKTGVKPDGFPIRPQIYNHLSQIIHDEDETPVADGSSSLPNVPPTEKQIVRNLTNFIMKEDKLVGFPYNREKNNRTPASQDNLPANQSWLGYYNTATRAYEDEPADVWKHFLTTGLANSSDTALGVPSITPAQYNRFNAQTPNLAFVPPPPPPPPAPRQPSFLENLGALAPLPPSKVSSFFINKKLEQRQAENKAEEARLLALTRQLGESNAYTLLLQQQYNKPPSVDTEALRRTTGEVERLQQQVGNISMAEEDELSRARQQQEFSQSEAGRAEEARLAEQARLAEEQAQREREEALKPRGVVTEAEKREIAQLESEAKLASSDENIDKMFDKISKAFSKETLARLPEEVRKDAKLLLNQLEDGRVAMKTLNQSINFKANKAKFEAELKTFPKGLEKIKKPNAAELKQLRRIRELEGELELVPTDAEIERDIAENERIKKKLNETQSKIAAIYKEYIVPKLPPTMLRTISQIPAKRGEEIEGLSETPFYDEEDTAKAIKQIYEPDGFTLEVSEMRAINEAIRDGINNAIKLTDEMKAAMDKGEITEAVFNRELDFLLDKTIEQAVIADVSSVVEDPSIILISRHSPMFLSMILEGVEGSLDPPFKNPKHEKQRKTLRGAIKDKFDGLKIFDNIFASYASIPDDRLLTINLMGQELAEVVEPGIVMSITADKDILGQVDKVSKIMMGDGKSDDFMFRQPSSPKLKKWVKNSRALLAGYTPLERNIVFASAAMKWNQERQFNLVYPESWMRGVITFPEGMSGSGKPRKLRGGGQSEKKRLIKRLVSRLHHLLSLEPTRPIFMEIDSLITSVKNEIEAFLAQPTYRQSDKAELRFYLHNVLVRIIERAKNVYLGDGRPRRRRE
jgi:hypothetical protein